MGFWKKVTNKVSEKVKDTVTEQTRENVKSFVKEHKGAIIGGTILLVGWGIAHHEVNRIMQHNTSLHDENMKFLTALATWDKTIDADMMMATVDDEAKMQKILPYTRHSLQWGYINGRSALNDPIHHIRFNAEPMDAGELFK